LVLVVYAFYAPPLVVEHIPICGALARMAMSESILAAAHHGFMDLKQAMTGKNDMATASFTRSEKVLLVSGIDEENL